MRVSQTVPPLAAFAALGVFWGAWSAVLPGVSASLAISDGALGLALLFVAAGALPAMLIAGRLTDRLGPRLLAPSVAAFGVAAVLPGLAWDGVSLGAFLLVLGAMSGGLDVVMNAVSAQVEAAYRARILHGAHAAFSGSAFLCSVLAGLLRQAGLTYPTILALAAAAILALAFAVRLTLEPLPPQEEQGSVTAQARPGSAVLPLVAILGGVCALAYLVENGLQLWSAQHIERELRGMPAVAALGPGILALSAVVGRLGGGRIARRIGDRPLIAWAGLVCAAGSFAFALAPSWPLGLAALAVAGAAVSVTAPSIFSIAGARAPAATRGAVVSNVATLAYLGFLVGPAALGLIADIVGLRGAIMAVGLIALALSGAALATLPSPKRMENAA